MTGEGVQNNELTYIYTGNPTQEAKPAATKWSGNVLCIVYSPSSEGPWENIAIRFISHPRFPRVGPIGYLLSVEFPPEQSGIATDALTNPHPRPTLRRYFEPELSEPEVGDVYSPAHDREVLFSLEMEFRTADLPRLRAQITLDPLVLAEEEDE
jgi:hypothetical protein